MKESFDSWNKTDPQPLRKRVHSDGSPSWIGMNKKVDFAEYSSAPRNKDSIPFGERKIRLPFPPESKASEIGEVKEYKSIWYKIPFELPEKWGNKRVFVHFDSADYLTSGYVNDLDKVFIRHRGGYSGFSSEITGLIRSKDNALLINTVDDMSDPLSPKGKQNPKRELEGCLYYPKTGISGPVWLSSSPQTYIGDFKHDPEMSADLKKGDLNTAMAIHGDTDDKHLHVSIYAGEEKVGYFDESASGKMRLSVPLKEVLPWDPREGKEPFLYKVEYVLWGRGGKEIDFVSSEFGLIGLDIKERNIVINGDKHLIRSLLYQAYDPRSLYLPPDIEHAREDIRNIKAMGFDMVRYHMNMPPASVAYEFDKAGLMWSLEEPNWGGDQRKPEFKYSAWNEYKEGIDQHYNSTALRFLTPLNETPSDQDPGLVPFMYENTKNYAGKNRIVINVSGFHHPRGAEGQKTDLHSVHFYDQSPEDLKKKLSNVATTKPIGLYEYGGVKTEFQRSKGEWGYGEEGGQPKNRKEALKKIKELTEAALQADPALISYTQYNACGKEKNGLVDEEGHPYPDMSLNEIHNVFSSKNDPEIR